jgi:hemerythrin-like domain-containing protein
MVEKNSPPNLAQDLLRMHKAITRGLTVGVAGGAEFMEEGFPDPGTRKGFTDYIQSLAVVLEAHHLGEDEIVFPSLWEKLPSAPYDLLSANHQEIDMFLGSIRRAIVDVAGEGDEGDLSLLVDDLRRVSAIWTPHIKLEEEHFSQDTLNTLMDPEEQGRVSAAIAKHSQEHATPPSLALPFVLFNLNAEDRAAMAATIPTMVMEELIPKAWKDLWAPMKPFLLE